jgi:hypothetical protein
VLGVTESDIDKGRIAPGEPDGDAMTDNPEQQAREPEP